MTIKQIKKAIEENISNSILTFDGFNSKRDTELKNELLHALKDKYSRPKDTDKKRIDRAGKTKEAEAYFLLKHGQTKPLTAKQLLDNPMFIYDFCCIDVQSESERDNHILTVLTALLKQSASVSTLFNNDFLNSLGDEVQTNLNASQLSKIATGYAHAAENVNTNRID